MHHLAIYNFNNFRVRSDEPINQGFHDWNAVNFRAAEISEGFVAGSGYEGEDSPSSWGPQVFPRFYIENGDGWAPSSLSLWRDLPSLFAFSYSGIHIEAMQKRDSGSIVTHGHLTSCGGYVKAIFRIGRKASNVWSTSTTMVRPPSPLISRSRSILAVT
jgi:hypothetical protein